MEALPVLVSALEPPSLHGCAAMFVSGTPFLRVTSSPTGTLGACVLPGKIERPRKVHRCTDARVAPPGLRSPRGSPPFRTSTGRCWTSAVSVARQGRRTEPLETRHGVVESYTEIEELLSNGEMRGRRWVLNRAQSVEHAGTKPTDHDILDLHGAMFGDFIEWAGTTRRDDRGPGGRVAVSWPDVRIQLRNLTLDLCGLGR